jgi:hypothetical protein
VLRLSDGGPFGARPVRRPAEGPWSGCRDARRDDSSKRCRRPPARSGRQNGTRRVVETTTLAGLARTRRGEGCARCSQLPRAPRANKLHPNSTTHTPRTYAHLGTT